MTDLEVIEKAVAETVNIAAVAERCLSEETIARIAIDIYKATLAEKSVKDTGES
ncbi:hypothetical protein LCGC14_0798070 [marine sediment metagenome]|uniref:Uncharacterized protein n=1 Tax=marine sediment metagenome TaxID=412755 RepID=A0A0F9PUX3_9ZZZZ